MRLVKVLFDERDNSIVAVFSVRASKRAKGYVILGDRKYLVISCRLPMNTIIGLPVVD